MLLTLAWRNIWRNKRRSIIVILSIVVGIFAIVLDESLQRGMMKQLLDNQVSVHLSHVQVHRKGFNDNPLVQSTIPDPARVQALLDTDRTVAMYGRRVILYGLANSAGASSGVAIVGVEPDREWRITDIASSIAEGGYLTGSPREAVIGRKLAEKLDLRLGDKLVLMASTAKGEVGSDLFRVRGIYRSFSSEFEKSFVYISLAAAQTMVYDRPEVSEIVVRMRERERADTLSARLRASLDSAYEALSYREALPMMVAQIELYEKMMYIVYVVVGTAMIFGIVNAMLMSIFERMREFGVLMAVGMKPGILFRMIILEAVLLGVTGSIIGMAASLPVYAWFAAHGMNLGMFSDSLRAWGFGSVIYPELPPAVILRQLFVVPVVCVIAALYPAAKALRLQPVQAMVYV